MGVRLRHDVCENGKGSVPSKTRAAPPSSPTLTDEDCLASVTWFGGALTFSWLEKEGIHALPISTGREATHD